jgi:hypothetical protein
MKKSKGTHRHDFDTLLVQDLLKKDKLSEEDAKRILDDACHVISGLRHDLSSILMSMEETIKTRQFWITGKVDI